jgi:hypothetical protein
VKAARMEGVRIIFESPGSAMGCAAVMVQVRV